MLTHLELLSRWCLVEVQVNPEPIKILLCLSVEIGEVKTMNNNLLNLLLLLTLELSLSVLLSSLFLGSLVLAESLNIERPNNFG